MIEEVAQQEVAYYMDPSVYVTNERVRLGDDVYALENVRWVGVQQRTEGMRVLGWEVPPGLAFDMLHGRIPWVFRAAVLWLPAAIAGLVRLYLPPNSGVSDATTFAVFVLGAGLMLWYYSRMGKQAKEMCVLGISTGSGTDYPLKSQDENYLKRIADAIKMAMRVRDSGY